MRIAMKQFLLMILIALPSMLHAQQDIPTMEAYITLELSNTLLHDYSKTAAVEYKELNVDLDKYTRAFDVIDLLYKSLRTSMNAYDTYNTVSTRIRDYKKLLEDYNEIGELPHDRQYLQRGTEPLPVIVRPCALCHWSCSLFHCRFDDGDEFHQLLAG